MIESLACGTPVIAYPRGSVTEILSHQESGFIVNNITDAIAAVKNIDQIPRQSCRNVFERRFTVERMMKDYLRIYRDEINLPINDINLNAATHELH